MKNKMALMLLSIACVGSVWATEPPEQQQGQEQEGYLTYFPEEMKVEVLVGLRAAGSLDEAVEAIRNLSLANKEFNEVANRPHVIKSLIRHLANRFDAPSMAVALKLNMPGAQQYIALSEQLVSALWDKDFDNAEKLLTQGADIDFQVSDIYPLWALTEENDIQLFEDLKAALGAIVAFEKYIALDQSLIAPIHFNQDIAGIFVPQKIEKDKINEFIFSLQENPEDFINYKQKVVKNVLDSKNALSVLLEHVLGSEGTNLFWEKFDEGNLEAALLKIASLPLPQSHSRFARKRLALQSSPYGREQISKFFVIGEGFSILMNALVESRRDIIEWLLEKGADSSLRMDAGDTPLLAAISMSDVEMVKLLLESGANVNQKNHLRADESIRQYVDSLLDSQGMKHLAINSSQDGTLQKTNNLDESRERMLEALYYMGETPLIRAINFFADKSATNKEDRKAIVDLLLEHGADVNAQDKEGDTALSSAVSFGDASIEMWVLHAMFAHGANPNIQNNDGNTPLITAVFEASPEIIQLLIENGADPTIKNNTGQTAMDIALSEALADDPDQPKKVELLDAAEKAWQAKQQ